MIILPSEQRLNHIKVVLFVKKKSPVYEVQMVLLVQVQNLWRFLGFRLLHFLTVTLWENKLQNKRSNYLQKMFFSCGHQVTKIHEMKKKARRKSIKLH